MSSSTHAGTGTPPPAPPTPSHAVNTPDDTLVQMHKILVPSQTNAFSISLLGGELLKWMDTCACLASERHSKHPSVTASMDDLQFRERVRAGQLVRISAKVTRAFNTSMEVAVKVFLEDPLNSGSVAMCEAYFTFVSLDSQGQKVAIPALVPVSEQDKDQHSLAFERRQIRLDRKTSIEKVAEILQNQAARRSSIDIAPENLSSSRTLLDGSRTVVPAGLTMVESWELVLPQHANHHNTAFGGQIMEWMEMNATVSASRLAKSYPLLASIDDIHFLGPIKVGERIIIRAQVNNSFTTSMEVGVRVDAVSIHDPQPRLVNTAYFTFVAIDGDGKRVKLPPLSVANADERLRHDEAIARRQVRLDRKKIRSEKAELAVHCTEDNLKELCLSNVSNLTILKSTRDWDVLSERDGIQFMTKDVGNTLVVRVECFVSASAGEVYQLLEDMSLRSEWDKLFVSYDTLRKIDSDNDIFHIKMRSPTSLVAGAAQQPPQDFVLLTSRRRPTDFSKHYVIAHRSVIQENMPSVQGYSRGEVGSSGFIITPTGSKGSDKTHIVYLNQFGSSVLSYMSGDMIGVSNMLHNSLVRLREFVSNSNSVKHLQETVLNRMIEQEQHNVDSLSEQCDRLFQPPATLTADLVAAQARLVELKKQRTAIMQIRRV
ncbi:acyl-CoA thioesterase 11 [Capsaspora owczarzaki ATCC 30864]|uniref:Acyl-CoA thioesterase 11 n=1 Tax=Capsaspora owczarzaki (strain ATCC 30864) TaxID=595528 RepID=A0A0D2VQJ8_CAPO3|nr:acyl-CoA thioesterase 11 [Capsaspora owczarzaki ATCC 30864]KJE92952.1 acyl-CoA thioesterase 11 [Capsaspora owczarzaki ATCC 30864]|eukprot:XP_004363552.1 acyl-CoA thioesterase 11 [Capsaspora owczarzaki ATCC 30864]